MASTVAGRIMWCSWSRNRSNPVAVLPASFRPPTGNQPSDAANTPSATMPIQYSGIEYVSMLSDVAVASNELPRRQPAR